MSDLAVREIDEIPGFFVISLALHKDPRGWFKENYQKEKMEALGLPKFEIVQNNFSFNPDAGVTRGMHAEPWEKFISLAYGKAYGAWIDLRKGESYGKKFELELSPETAVFVPRGVANGYQTLEANTTYSYVVNAHWSADAKYQSMNLFDPDCHINWPIHKDQAIISDKDQLNPMLKDITPMEF